MLVTIIIPTYNRPDYLRAALETVLAQSYTDYECLVVNDHPDSRGAVDQVVGSLNDARLRVIHQPRNRGHAAARNTAIRQAQGKVIAFLDDDDLWLPDFLDQHMRIHTAQPEVGVVYCGFIEFWDENHMTDRVMPAQAPPVNLRQQMLRGDFVLASSSIISLKKKILTEDGIWFDEDLPSFVDWDMWVRCAAVAPFAHIETPLVRYRYHLKYRASVNINHRMKGIQGISAKWADEPDFHHYQPRLKFNAYFNEIRNRVLMHQRWQGVVLVGKCFRDCGWQVLRHSRMLFKLGVILLLGRAYPHVQKIRYQRQSRLAVTA